MNKILFHGEEFHFSEDSLPILIHGHDHVGASLFTVSLIADLYAQGSKIVFLSGYSMARDEFIKQAGEPVGDRVTFIKGTESSECIKKINELGDIDERIVLIKNIELFDQKIFDAVFNNNKLVISGDIEKVPYKEYLLNKKIKTKILFSSSSFAQIPRLQ